MHYEVEQKHRVADVRSLEERLAERGVEIGPPVVQVDRYYAHPCRDFAQTDEALRIRTVGAQSFVTYKGPKLDTVTKTRQELELPLDRQDDDGLQFAELLALLGFRSVAVVRKRRRKFLFEFDDERAEGVLDDVDGIGQFVELEITADEGGLDAARQRIAKLAAELTLGPSERRSYLELLLAKSGKPASN